MDDAQSVKYWFDLLQTLAIIGVTFWIWNADRKAARKKEVDDEIARLSQRVTVVEERVKAAPNDEDLKRIYDQIGTVSGELQELVGEFRGVRRTLDLLQEHLLNSRTG